MSYIPHVFVALIPQSSTTSFCIWSEVYNPSSSRTRTCNIFNYLRVRTTDHDANTNFGAFCNCTAQHRLSSLWCKNFSLWFKCVACRGFGNFLFKIVGAICQDLAGSRSANWLLLVLIQMRGLQRLCCLKFFTQFVRTW